jgi:hypothetical protein
MDNIELTVMDDIRSPESPQVSRRSARDNSSSDEEDNSESEEDRYAVPYTLLPSAALCMCTAVHLCPIVYLFCVGL